MWDRPQHLVAKGRFRPHPTHAHWPANFDVTGNVYTHGRPLGPSFRRLPARAGILDPTQAICRNSSFKQQMFGLVLAALHLQPYKQPGSSVMQDCFPRTVVSAHGMNYNEMIKVSRTSLFHRSNIADCAIFGSTADLSIRNELLAEETEFHKGKEQLVTQEESSDLINMSLEVQAYVQALSLYIGETHIDIAKLDKRTRKESTIRLDPLLGTSLRTTQMERLNKTL